ncbi:Hypothetical_protein [Hexamita inflata]|uniref:Hypothetical_protein n=1 Tax=Hexamita inflata TaxID=28002 RepID=A0AA86P2R2_9EUKA|nr:Hypothetical protein HINF_LOCUS17171 [Hexamita inflata]
MALNAQNEVKIRTTSAYQKMNLELDQLKKKRATQQQIDDPTLIEDQKIKQLVLTMKSRIKMSNTQSVTLQVPNCYVTQSQVLGSEMGMSIMQKHGPGLFDEPQFHIPSPTKYNTDKSSLSQSGGGISIDHQVYKIKHPERKLPTPGPGSYTIANNIQIKEKLVPFKPEKQKIFPGPLDYRKEKQSPEKQPGNQITRNQVPKIQRYDFKENTPGFEYMPLPRSGSASIANKYNDKLDLITPAPLNTTKALDFLRPKISMSIREKSYNKQMDFDGSEARQVRIEQKIQRIQQKKSVKLTNLLREKLEEGRRELKIGMEGKYATKDERIQYSEQFTPFKTFKTKNPLELHFSLAVCGKFNGILHGAILVQSNYPHNKPKLKIFTPGFKKFQFCQETQYKWDPSHEYHVLIQEFIHSVKKLLEDDVDFTAISDQSKYFKCDQCGTNHVLLWEDMRDNTDGWY